MAKVISLRSQNGKNRKGHLYPLFLGVSAQKDVFLPLLEPPLEPQDSQDSEREHRGRSSHSRRVAEEVMVLPKRVVNDQIICIRI